MCKQTAGKKIFTFFVKSNWICVCTYLISRKKHSWFIHESWFHGIIKNQLRNFRFFSWCEVEIYVYSWFREKIIQKLRYIITFQAIKNVGSSWPMVSCHIIAIKLKWLILAEELLVFMGRTFIQRIVAIS